MKLFSYYWVPLILFFIGLGVYFTDFRFGGTGIGDTADGWNIGLYFGPYDWFGIPCLIAARMLYKVKMKLN